MEAGTGHKNYYELLGLERGASRTEIKQAYRDIALVYHPDSRFFDEILDERLRHSQTEMFKLITAAYHTLISPNSRAEYDSTLPPDLPAWKRPNERDRSWIEPKLEQAVLRAGQAGRPGAFGVFGRVRPGVESSFDGGELRLQSIAELRKRSLRVRARVALEDAAAVIYRIGAEACRWCAKRLGPLHALISH